MTLTVIIATLGRPSLEKALLSVVSQRYVGDEVIVVTANPDVKPLADANACRFVLIDKPGNDWGDTERMVGMPLATGEYVAFMDDDDVYVDGAREAIEVAAAQHPGQPLLFKLKFDGSGVILPGYNRVDIGNVGTPCLVAPNDAKRLGRWGCRKNRDRGGDYDYVSSMKWAHEDIAWMPNIIAHIGAPNT